MIRALAVLLVLALVPAASADAAVSKKKAISGPSDIDGSSQFDTYKDLGAGIFETTLSWSDVAVEEPIDAKDPFDPGYSFPDSLQTAVDEGKRTGISVAVDVTGIPSWADKKKPAKQLADFLTAAARQYPTIRLWTIEDTKLSATQYAAALDAASVALHARSKLNLVVSAPSTVSSASKWIKGLKLASGKTPRFDLYGHDPSAKGKLDVKKIEGQVKDAFGSKRLFLTNYTLPIALSDKYSFHFTQAVAGQRLIAAYKAIKSDSRVYALSYNGLTDADLQSDGRNVKSGLIDNTGAKRATYNAFKKALELQHAE